MDQPLSHLEAFRILEVPPNAQPAQIQQAYRRMVMIWHPDRFEAGTEIHTEATEKFKTINEAYKLLKDFKPVSDPEKPAPSTTRQTRPKDSTNHNASQSNTASENKPLPYIAVFLIASLCIFLLAKIPWHGDNASNENSATRQNNYPTMIESKIQVKSRVEEIRQPGVYVFSPRSEESGQTGNFTSNDLSSFSDNLRLFKKYVQQRFPDIEIMTTHAEELRFDGRSFFREQTRGYGFIFFFPPFPLRVLEGNHSPIQLMEILATMAPSPTQQPNLSFTLQFSSSQGVASTPSTPDANANTITPQTPSSLIGQ